MNNWLCMEVTYSFKHFYFAFLIDFKSFIVINYKFVYFWYSEVLFKIKLFYFIKMIN